VSQSKQHYSLQSPIWEPRIHISLLNGQY
jgi:hypothetical protein